MNQAVIRLSKKLQLHHPWVAELQQSELLGHEVPASSGVKQRLIKKVVHFCILPRRLLDSMKMQEGTEK